MSDAISLSASSGDRDVCRWCLRVFDLKGRRRRERGLECTTCPVVIAENYPHYSKNKPEFVKQLREPGDKHSEFLSHVSTFEEDVENGTRRRGKRGPGGSRPGRTSVLAQQTAGFEGRTCLGVFWPESIYELKEHFGEKVPKKKRHYRDGPDGRKVVGIVLPSSHGCPDGCTQLLQVDANTTFRQSLLYDSSVQTREEAEGEIWDLARERTSVKRKVDSEPLTEGGPHAVSLTSSSPMTKKKKTADDDDDLTDLLWGPNIGAGTGAGSGGSGCNPEGGGGQAPKAKPPAAKTKIAKTVFAGVAGGAAQLASENKVAREMATTEQVLLVGTQTFRYLGCPSTYTNVTTKTMEGLCHKLETRLTQPLIALYTQADGVPKDEQRILRRFCML